MTALTAILPPIHHRFSEFLTGKSDGLPSLRAIQVKCPVKSEQRGGKKREDPPRGPAGGSKNPSASPDVHGPSHGPPRAPVAVKKKRSRCENGNDPQADGLRFVHQSP